MIHYSLLEETRELLAPECRVAQNHYKSIDQTHTEVNNL